MQIYVLIKYQIFLTYDFLKKQILCIILLYTHDVSYVNIGFNLHFL